MSEARTGQRERTAAGDEQQETDRTDELVCPECSGNLATDTAQGETVCEDCGLVVETDEIDRGPEWRAFDSREDRKSVV